LFSRDLRPQKDTGDEMVPTSDRKEEQKKDQDSFFCLKGDCASPLERIAKTRTIDGGACGDGYRYEYYECVNCQSLYSRLDFDSFVPLSYSGLQKDIEFCSEIPNHDEFCFKKE